MTRTRTLSLAEVRLGWIARQEQAVFDLRTEAAFATAHPLFAAHLAADRIDVEAAARLPRRDVRVVIYDDGEALIDGAADALARLGFENVYALAGDLRGYREAGYELFQDVNSYSKAFGELVEARRHTPSISAEELHAQLEGGADVTVVDARRFDEYATMSIPTSTSVPGAELVLRAPSLARGRETTLVVNCAGRTRSIVGAQSLINAGTAQRVVALRNGTIGWTLAGQQLDHGQARRAPEVAPEVIADARARARAVAYRAGVRRISAADLDVFVHDPTRTLYRFDVRSEEEHARGHREGFRSAPGGQLVQEIDMFAPVRGARIVLGDPLGARADMTASWLAQLGWEVYVLDAGLPDAPVRGVEPALPPRLSHGRYRRPYEGTDNPRAAMEAYLEWEYGLVAQLERDGTHGFFVI
ncbi:MAG: rhodanese-like domain-containing protein [Polyangiales bacterium]